MEIIAAMVFPGEQWEKACPEDQGLDAGLFRDAVDFLHANVGGAGADEMVVVRDGYLIWEGAAADRVHEIYSATKTFTSTVLGLLVTDGVLRVDDLAILERNGNIPGFNAGDIALGDIYRLRQYRPPVMLARLSSDQIQAVLGARMYLTTGCSFVRQENAVTNLSIQAEPDSIGRYLVAMERQIAFRHFLRNAETDSVAFDFSGQRVDTALERYLRDVKVVR